MAAFGFREVERQHVVVDAEQLGHLADQLVLHALGDELVGLRVELRQHLLKEVVEVLYQRAALGVALPREHAGLAHDRQAFDLVAAEPAVEHGRDRRQEVAHRVVHPADVRLLDREAISGETAGQLGLAQGGAAFLLVELARLLDAEGALDERQAPTQFVLGQVAGQHHDFAAAGPGPEQARYAEEPLVLGLRPQFAQDRQACVAAVADDVVALARASGDRRRRIKAALADGRLDVLVGRIALLPGVVVVGTQLVQGHDHGRVGDRVAQGRGGWAAALEPGREQLAGHLLGGHLNHGGLPALGIGPRARRGGSAPGH